VDNYFARVNSAGLVTAVGATLFSAWLSGEPVQRANDMVFRPWYLERLKRKKHKAEMQGKTFDSNLHRRQVLSRGGVKEDDPVSTVQPGVPRSTSQMPQRVALWSGKGV
jgi:hypothetical protein